jgi:hypothetical protein
MTYYIIKNQEFIRAIGTLDAIRKRIWKDKCPLVTEVELKKTGHGSLNPTNIITILFGLGVQE